MADVVVLALLICVLGLIVRGMIRGSVKGCEGDCSHCGHICSDSQLRLTEEQIEELRALSERYEAQQ